MGGVKSWSIQYDVLAGAKRRRPAASRAGGTVEVETAREAGSAVEERLERGNGNRRSEAAGGSEIRPFQVRTRKTTGLFGVVESDGNPIQVVLLLSSFAGEEQSAIATVNRYGPQGRETVLFRALDVPAGGAARVELEGLAGDTIEVIFSLPSDDLLPSVAVTKTFIADGAVVLQQLKTPAHFVRI